MTFMPKSSNSNSSAVVIRSSEDVLRVANQFLEQNNIDAAYPLVNSLAESCDNRSDYSITAGLLAVSLELPDQAKRHFRRAISITPDDFDANYNLALVELQTGNIIEAESILTSLVARYPHNGKLYNDLGVMCMSQEHYHRAHEYLRTSLELDPDNSQTRKNLAETERKLRSQVCPSLRPTDDPDGGEQSSRITDKRIVFFANHPSFLTDLTGYLAIDNEVRLYERPSLNRMKEMMAWADIAWFEWCDNLIIAASHLPGNCRIVCRLHSYEVFTDMPQQVNWSAVDYLLFVNQSVRELFERQVDCRVPRRVIHNGVNTNQFTIPLNKTYGRKIASVGYINYKKNPTLLLYCFKKIHSYNPDYSLHLAGTFQDDRIELYFDHFLKENPLPVYFDGWVDDMSAWYADKDFIISTSLFESFHYSIAEGMAAGVMPLIHNWWGVKQLYPEEYLFSDPDECLRLVQAIERADKRALAEENRQYICERYHVNERCSEIAHLLGTIVDHVPPETPNEKEVSHGTNDQDEVRKEKPSCQGADPN